MYLLLIFSSVVIACPELLANVLQPGPSSPPCYFPANTTAGPADCPVDGVI